MSRVRMVLSLAVLLGFVVPTDAATAAGSLAERCPGYLVALQRARLSLLDGDRAAAIAALRGADAALAECIRRDSDEASGRVLLAASPEVATEHYGLTD